MARGTGILLNNEMDDFSVKPGTQNSFGLTGEEANAIAPGKQPVSSMTPTIILQNNTPVLALGAPGGSTIISGVLQTLLNYFVWYPGDLARSVFAPRLHHQWLPDKVFAEKEGFSTELLEALTAKGHSIDAPVVRPLVEAVAIVRSTKSTPKKVSAVFDPRDFGGAEAR
jgi:gamma-glutamyltranspeptidase/glutathione hydrolase